MGGLFTKVAFRAQSVNTYPAELVNILSQWFLNLVINLALATKFDT